MRDFWLIWLLGSAAFFLVSLWRLRPTMRDFFKALRTAWLAGKSTFHRQRWLQRKRREIRSPF